MKAVFKKAQISSFSAVASDPCMYFHHQKVIKLKYHLLGSSVDKLSWPLPKLVFLHGVCNTQCRMISIQRDRQNLKHQYFYWINPIKYLFSLTLLTEESVVEGTPFVIQSMILLSEHRGASLSLIVWFSRTPALILPGGAVTPVPFIVIPVTPNPDNLTQVFSKAFQKFMSLQIRNGCEVSL